MSDKKIQTIEAKVIEQTFKNKEFAEAVTQAIGDRLVDAIRTIDDWDFSYELKKLMGEVLFSEAFKEEIKLYAQSYIEENKEDIKQLVKERMSITIITGVTEASAKIGELLVNKSKDVSKIY